LPVIPGTVGGFKCIIVRLSVFPYSFGHYFLPWKQHAVLQAD
jgi:hypothetical protein